MSSSPYGFLYNPTLPSEETIVAHCLNLGFVRRTTIVDPSTTSVIAWIKYGPALPLTRRARSIGPRRFSVTLVPQTYKPLRIPCVYCRLRVLNWLRRHGVHGAYRLPLEQRRTSCESCPGVDRPPSTTNRDAWTHWWWYKFYCTLLQKSFFPEWLSNVNYKSYQNFYAHIHTVSVCQRLKVMWRTQNYVRSLSSCASIFMAIYLATADSSVLPIST